MLFTLTLGIVLGIAGVTLVRQWIGGSLEPEQEPAEPLSAAAFPRLAPPRLGRLRARPQRYRTWRRAA